MDRDCEHCIFHDDGCRRWDCKMISREQAERAVEAWEKVKAEIADYADDDRVFPIIEVKTALKIIDKALGELNQ